MDNTFTIIIKEMKENCNSLVNINDNIFTGIDKKWIKYILWWIRNINLFNITKAYMS